LHKLRLLSRFAEDLFWLARYVERAESVARFLDITKTYAGSEQDSATWRRVLALYGDARRFEELGRTPDASSVLAFYLHDKNNPTSVPYSLARAHDNARGARHLISTEMWMHLNVVRRQHEAMTLRDVRLSNVSNICQKIKIDCQTFEGIVEGTLMRGDIWLFYEIGKVMERADQTTRILDIGYSSLWTDEEDAAFSVRWNTLVRSLAGYHGFRATHPAGTNARDIADFLLYGEDFVRSTGFCMGRVSQWLHELSARLDEDVPPEIQENLAGITDLMREKRQMRLSAREMSKYIDIIQKRISDLGVAIGERYFLSLPEEVEA
jgi:uncharacterized alpha-E superfamily protein